MTPYEVVFDSFRRKIEDLDLPLFPAEIQIQMQTGWLDDAIGYIEMDDLKLINDLTLRDNTLQTFEADLTSGEILGLSLYMVVAWYEVIINSMQHTMSTYATKEEKWDNTRQHLDGLKNNQESYRLKAKSAFIGYGYRHNSYLTGGE